jgi:hypothetical protein
MLNAEMVTDILSYSELGNRCSDQQAKHPQAALVLC